METEPQGQCLCTAAGEAATLASTREIYHAQQSAIDVEEYTWVYIPIALFDGDCNVDTVYGSSAVHETRQMSHCLIIAVERHKNRSVR